MPRKKMKCYKKKQSLNPKQKNLKKQYDQIYDDFHSKLPKILPRDLDLPGEGQYYCTACGEFYIDQLALNHHLETKQHKRK